MWSDGYIKGYISSRVYNTINGIQYRRNDDDTYKIKKDETEYSSYDEACTDNNIKSLQLFDSNDNKLVTYITSEFTKGYLVGMDVNGSVFNIECYYYNVGNLLYLNAEFISINGTHSDVITDRSMMDAIAIVIKKLHQEIDMKYAIYLCNEKKYSLKEGDKNKINSYGKLNDGYFNTYKKGNFHERYYPCRYNFTTEDIVYFLRGENNEYFWGQFTSSCFDKTTYGEEIDCIEILDENKNVLFVKELTYTMENGRDISLFNDGNFHYYKKGESEDILGYATSIRCKYYPANFDSKIYTIVLYDASKDERIMALSKDEIPYRKESKVGNGFVYDPFSGNAVLTRYDMTTFKASDFNTNRSNIIMGYGEFEREFNRT